MVQCTGKGALKARQNRDKSATEIGVLHSVAVGQNRDKSVTKNTALPLSQRVKTVSKVSQISGIVR